MIRSMREKRLDGGTAGRINAGVLAAGAVRGAFFILLARTVVPGGYSPFVAACFTAGLACGWPALPMLVGCAAGCLTLGLDGTNFVGLAACAIISLAWRALIMLAPALKLKMFAGRQLRSPEVCVFLFAGLGSAIAGLAFAHGSAGPITNALISSAACAALAPTLIPAMGVSLSRTALMRDEQLSLALLLVILLAGLAAIPVAGTDIALAAGALLVLTAARRGSSAGAAAGIAAGASIFIMSGDITIVAILGICGLAAGFLGRLPVKWARYSSAALLILSLSALSMFGGARAIPPALIGAIAYCALPTRTLRWADGLMAAEMGRQVDRGKVSARACRQSARKLREAGGVFAAMADEYGAAHHRPDSPEYASGAEPDLIERQMRYASHLLYSLSDELPHKINLDAAGGEAARAALDRAGVRLADVYAVNDGRLEIIATPERSRADIRAIERAAEWVSDELGLPLTASYSGAEIRLIEAPMISVSAAVRSRAKEAGAPCGDQHVVRVLRNGKLFMAMSDGMGSGSRAAEESGGALKLLCQFMEADIASSLALDTINNLFVLNSREDMFATIDMCIVDLLHSSATFTKLGACSSMLIRDGAVIKIPGGRLPLGIVDSVRPMGLVEPLRPGDMIVMVTDGVADIARDGQEEWLASILSHLDFGDTPETVGDKIIARAVARDAGLPGDDMTVLVAEVFANRG